MKIPMPCKFGEIAECNGKCLPLVGVTWFKWSGKGMEYTYFFSIKDKWHNIKFYSALEKTQPFEIDIPDSLLKDKPIKEHGYPLKGSGYAYGVSYIDGKMYIEFIMTSAYLAHIEVQCDSEWKYFTGGDIIFPPSWDTEEKKEKAVLKKYWPVQDSLKKAAELPRQMTVFEIM